MIEIEMRRGEAGLYSPVGHPGAAAGKGRSDGPSHVAFWLRPVSLFGRFGVTSPASLHVRSAFHVSPGRAPPRGWQGCRRCPRSFTPWVTPQHVRVGAPKHHRVRPGCPDRHSNLDPCNILPSGVLESGECFWSRSSPSANTPSRDILFPAARIGRNPAECRRFCSFIRTTDTGREARFGPFSVSLRPLSLTQPNHARFGTDVRTALIQLVRWPMRECGFERAALRRSERDSNRSGRRRDMAAFTQRPLTRRAVRRRSRA